MWGLMVGLPRFASHGSGLHLGAGCQKWKLLDVSGTQPPLCEAVVNSYYILDTVPGIPHCLQVPVLEYSSNPVACLVLLQAKTTSYSTNLNILYH